MKTRHIALLTVFLACLSCTQEDRQGQAIRPLNQEPLKVELSDLVDSVHYIALETSGSCLLGEVAKARRAGDYYLVRDQFGLYAFDGNGKFVTEIGRKGKGHREYTRLDNFFVDDKRQLIGLVCNHEQEIMYYTYDGEYHHTVRIAADNTGIAFVLADASGNLIACYPLPNDYEAAPFEYKELREYGDTLSGRPLLPAKRLTTKDIYYEFLTLPMTNHRGTTLLLSALSHDLYAYHDGATDLELRFAPKKPTPSDSYLEQHEGENFMDLREAIRASGMSVGFTAIQSDGTYLFLSDPNEGILIWDGERCVQVKSVFDEKRGHYFTDLVQTGGCSDEHLGLYDAHFLSQQKEKAPSRDRKWNALVRSIQETDNPVLYRFAFKKNLIDHLADKYGPF